MNAIGKYEFLAEPFRCDFNGRLMYSTLGNYMLNAADYQSSERGFGWNELKRENKAWVLSRFVMEMSEMPGPYDRFDIATWVESVMRYFTYRNWSVIGKDGKVYGYGTSVWAMIDLTTRQPADIFSVNDGRIRNFVSPDDKVPIDSPSRVKMDGKNATLIREIDVTYSDLDVNGHVNSIRYIEHVLDLFPTQWHQLNHITRIEVAYVAESHYGDRLRFYEERQDDNSKCFMITRLNDDTEQEVVRCRIVYPLHTSQM